MERMSHTVLLCFEIAQIIGVRRYLDGDVFYDFESVGLQTDTLYGIIGKQAHLVDTQIT